MLMEAVALLWMVVACTARVVWCMVRWSSAAVSLQAWLWAWPGWPACCWCTGVAHGSVSCSGSGIWAPSCPKGQQR
jgi:hypothetical protein